MSRPFRRVALLTLCALGASAAAHAGAVYVALPGTSTVGPVAWAPEVAIANPAGVATQVKGLLLTGETDGTVRSTPATPTQVEAARTFIYHPAASFRGLLEISGSPLARTAARLEGTGPLGALGVTLPVITSENVVKGGDTIALLGLTRSATRTTNVAVINLAPYASTCSLSLVRADGSALGAPRALALLPLSQTWVGDALAGLVDASGIADVRAHVSCARDFYAWALLGDSANGEVATVLPTGDGDSLLAVPGEEAPCVPGAICQTSNLVFHPTPAEPVGHVIFQAPAGTFTRIRLEMEVTVGEFYPGDPDGKHLIYWFVINKNINMPGMLYFRGPEAYTALVRYGINLKHPQKLKLVDPNFKAVPGRTYHVVNDFDMGHGLYTVTISDVATGQIVSTMTGAPNVPKFTIKEGDRFLVDMGFKEGVVPDEVPSFNGWVYSKVRVDAIP